MLQGSGFSVVGPNPSSGASGSRNAGGQKLGAPIFDERSGCFKAAPLEEANCFSLNTVVFFGPSLSAPELNSQTQRFGLPETVEGSETTNAIFIESIPENKISARFFPFIKDEQQAIQNKPQAIKDEQQAIQNKPQAMPTDFSPLSNKDINEWCLTF